MDGRMGYSNPESSMHSGGSGNSAQMHMCAGHCARASPSAPGHQPAFGDKHAPWIRAMLMNSYFGTCRAHPTHKKNECTYFCITCGYDNPHALCQHCIVDHTGHSTIQIRRYVYCDVIRAMDISPYIDITGVQNYIINQAKVLFLNHRPQAKKGSPSASDVCRTCCRTLREGYLFCSLACKMDSMGGALLPRIAPALRTAVGARAMAGAGSSDDSCEEEEAVEEEEMPVQPSQMRTLDYRTTRVAFEAAPASKRQCVQPLVRQSSDSSSEEAFPSHLHLAPSHLALRISLNNFNMESLMVACGCGNNQQPGSGGGGGVSVLQHRKLTKTNSRRKQFSPRKAPCV